MTEKQLNYFIKELKQFDSNKKYTDEYYDEMTDLGDRFFNKETTNAIKQNDLERFNILNLYNVYFLEELYDQDILKSIIKNNQIEFMIALVQSNSLYVTEFYDILRELDWEDIDVKTTLHHLFHDKRISKISQDTEWFARYTYISHENQRLDDKFHIEYYINDVYQLIIKTFIEHTMSENEFLSMIGHIIIDSYTTQLKGSSCILTFRRTYYNILKKFNKYQDKLIDLIYETYHAESIRPEDLIHFIKTII